MNFICPRVITLPSPVKQSKACEAHCECETARSRLLPSLSPGWLLLLGLLLTSPRYLSTKQGFLPISGLALLVHPQRFPFLHIKRISLKQFLCFCALIQISGPSCCLWLQCDCRSLNLYFLSAYFRTCSGTSSFLSLSPGDLRGNPEAT